MFGFFKKIYSIILLPEHVFHAIAGKTILSDM